MGDVQRERGLADPGQTDQQHRGGREATPVTSASRPTKPLADGGSRAGRVAGWAGALSGAPARIAACGCRSGALGSTPSSPCRGHPHPLVGREGVAGPVRAGQLRERADRRA
nr:hypothetical protein GCM10020063_048030 [Dactylosporangium thailandense]